MVVVKFLCELTVHAHPRLLSLVPYVVDLFKDDPTDFPHDFSTPVQHGSENLNDHDEG